MTEPHLPPISPRAASERQGEFDWAGGIPTLIVGLLSAVVWLVTRSWWLAVLALAVGWVLIWSGSAAIRKVRAKRSRQP